MRVIVLAAGQGFQIDGMNKCLIRDPCDGRTILDKIIRAFPDCRITVVVGYRAIAVMQEYPGLDYVLNPDWAVTNNSYSLALTLNQEPCYVLSGDLLFEPDLIRELNLGAPDVVLTACRENRIQSAVNCMLDGLRIVEMYQGRVRSPKDPEAIGLFKISHPQLLQRWRQNCLEHGNLFVGLNLPLDGDSPPLHFHDRGAHRFDEINTPLDYWNLLKTARSHTS
jgi:choline kinase